MATPNPPKESVQSRVPRRSIPSLRMRKANSFIELSDKLNSLKDDYAIVREAVDGLMTILEARAGLLMVAEPVGIIYSQHRNHSEMLAAFERTLRQRGSRVLTLFSLEPHKRLHETDGLILIPLSSKDEFIGLIALDCDGGKIGHQHQAEFLLLVNHLSSVFRARHQPSRSSAEGTIGVRSNDIEEAVAMQRSLQPALPARSCGLLIATHMQAAEFVAGDYFDLILVDKHKMGIVIADVEGKGLSAALFANMLRTTVHFLTRESPSTSSVVSKISSILHKETSSTKLFTLFYAVFDSVNKILTYTGSGHVAPVVLRADRSGTGRLNSDSLPIGIAQRQRFAERSVQLFPGDTVVYLTDGLIERVNREGQQFGEDRLVQLLEEHQSKSPEEILRILLEECSTFASAAPSDDQTIIITRVE